MTIVRAYLMGLVLVAPFLVPMSPPSLTVPNLVANTRYVMRLTVGTPDGMGRSTFHFELVTPSATHTFDFLATATPGLVGIATDETQASFDYLFVRVESP